MTTRPPVTRSLSEGLVQLAAESFDDPVIRATERSLLNVIGTTVGAARSDAVEAVVRYANEVGQAGEVPLLGRSDRLAPTAAALATGIAAHYDDFDDTHLETVIHPAAVGIGALLATAPVATGSGQAVLRAFALGIEGQLRIGAAISPSHYDLGWHITGTCGAIGSAITAGLLLDLDAEELESAIGVAATMTVGVRQAFGTMTKPFHPGRASANGVLAARMVAAGLAGPRSVFEAEGGLTDVLTRSVAWDRVTADLGERWELVDNTFKPYPCGIVSHPAIAAASMLHDRLPTVDHIDQVVIRCHPLVPELTGNGDPRDGLEARFSTIHGVCAGLADGPVALAQYTDDRVRADDLTRLRARTSLEIDDLLARDAAVVVVTTSDGTTVEQRVDHAPGSLARPLTDDELLAKVSALIEPVLPGRTLPIHEAVLGLSEAPGLGPLLAATTPSDPGNGERS